VSSGLYLFLSRYGTNTLVFTGVLLMAPDIFQSLRQTFWYWLRKCWNKAGSRTEACLPPCHWPIAPLPCNGIRVIIIVHLKTFQSVWEDQSAFGTPVIEILKYRMKVQDGYQYMFISKGVLLYNARYWLLIAGFWNCESQSDWLREIIFFTWSKLHSKTLKLSEETESEVERSEKFILEP